MPRPRPLLPLLAAAVLVSSVLIGVVGPSASPADAAGPLCGPSRTERVNNRVWTCTFDDEFAGSSLDGSKWSPLTTVGYGWTTSDTCYVNNGSTIGVSGGQLHLTARQLSSPMSCGGAYDTVHAGGAVMTNGHFSQTYGRFEFRARFPATDQSGFWADLWLYPDKLTYGGWPASGEIDVAEHWTGHGDNVYSSLHYTGSTGADNKACAMVDASTFHTYAVEWTANLMRFYTDGTLCFQRDWTSVTGSTMPFDKPFFSILSEGWGDFNQGVSAAIPPSGRVDVDYVRFYR